MYVELGGDQEAATFLNNAKATPMACYNMGKRISRMHILIRAEQHGDFAAIGEVHCRAFDAPHGSAVATLVSRIRASDRYVPELGLVAVQEEKVIGHILLSYTDLLTSNGRRQILMLSPLGVDPAVQRLGVGSALTKAALKLADHRGEPMDVLEGIPSYYPRFGFRLARSLGIQFPEHVPEPAAQVCPLSAYDQSLCGNVVYPDAFDGLH